MIASFVADLKRLVNNMDYLKTGTRTDRGLELVADQLYIPEGGDRPGARNLLIIITDGNSQGKTRPLQKFLMKLKVCYLLLRSRILS